jgi:hypothetical protein
MEIFININGVIRNLIQKFEYHYNEEFLLSEFENENNFEYGVSKPILNNDISNSFKFQSIDEFEFFTFIEYPIEIFGHAGLSYPTAVSDLNKLMFEYSGHNFTVVSIDERGKSKPATLFFLSKNGFLGNNIRFIRSEDIEKEWEKCDVWITDDKKVIDTKPENKIAIKFNTPHNEFFTNKEEITKLTEIENICLRSLEETTTSTQTEL